MLLNLAPAARQFEPSSTLAINERVQQLTAQGRQIFHLGFGESRFPVHPKVLDAFHQHATERFYTPVAGLPELRATIADFYSQEWSLPVIPEQVIVGAGSKSLLYALLLTLDGDVLLPRPAWVTYAPQVQMTGKCITWIDTTEADEYCLTEEPLLEAIAQARRMGQNPRILILNTPNNPTGVVYPAHLLAKLGEVARRNNLTIISDEIYALINHGWRPHISPAQLYPEGTIVTSGLSKHLSLGGWRFGVAILPATPAGAAVMDALMAVAGAIWTAPATPVQHAAIVAYQDDPDLRTYIRKCATIHATVVHALYQELTEAGIPCPRPSGAYYLYPHFNPWRDPLQRRSQITTSDDLARLLLEEYELATLPGTAFGAPPEDLSLRLSTSHFPAQNDAQAATALEAFDHTSDPATFIQSICPAVLEVGRRLRMFVESL